MFKVESFDDDLLADELFDEISTDIQKMAGYASAYVVKNSPVDTGLFKGNWNVSINQEYDGQFINEDPSGTETLAGMMLDIGGFNLKEDNIIFIQNSVMDIESGNLYAPTVGWDFTTQTADSLVSGAVIVAAEAIN